MQITRSLPLLDEILVPWQECLGADYVGYRNHLYRMLHYCFYLGGPTGEDRQKLIIAAAFHDLGIWSAHTLDYLPPSIELARRYLREQGLWHWGEEIALMIDMHHKVTPYRGVHAPLVELFRQGDRVDFSWGLCRCGVSAEYVAAVKAAFPNAGFHKCLAKLAWQQLKRAPFNPAPMMKW